MKGKKDRRGITKKNQVFCGFLCHFNERVEIWKFFRFLKDCICWENDWIIKLNSTFESLFKTFLPAPIIWVVPNLKSWPFNPFFCSASVCLCLLTLILQSTPITLRMDEVGCYGYHTTKHAFFHILTQKHFVESVGKTNQFLHVRWNL